MRPFWAARPESTSVYLAVWATHTHHLEGRHWCWLCHQTVRSSDGTWVCWICRFRTRSPSRSLLYSLCRHLLYAHYVQHAAKCQSLRGSKHTRAMSLWSLIPLGQGDINRITRRCIEAAMCNDKVNGGYNRGILPWSGGHQGRIVIWSMKDE